MEEPPVHERGSAEVRVRIPIAAFAATAGSVAFQMSVDAGWIKNFGWAIPWVWALCFALWCYWAISHPKITDGRFKDFHSRIGRGIYVLRIAVCAVVFIFSGSLVRLAAKSFSRPTITTESTQVHEPAKPTAPPPSDEPAPKPIAPAKSRKPSPPQTTGEPPNNGPVQQPTSQSTPSSVIAPGGIANSNSPNYGNQTVNNFGPPPVQFSWIAEDVAQPTVVAQPSGEVQYQFEKTVTVSVSGTYTPVSLAVQCDSKLEKVEGLLNGNAVMLCTSV